MVLNDQGEKPEKSNRNQLGWGKFLLFFLTYLAVQVVVIAVAMIITVITSDFNDIDLLIENFLTSQWLLYLDFLGFLITVFIFKSARQFLRKAFSFAPLKKGRTYLYLIGAFIFMYFAEYVILDVLQWEDATEQVEIFGFDKLSLGWVSIIIILFGMAVITPVKEEFLFRGILHGFLSEKWGFWLGLILSSVIFGLLHPGYAISASIMGAVFVGLYRLTRSLIVPILLHIVWNAFAVVGLIMYVSGL